MSFDSALRWIARKQLEKAMEISVAALALTLFFTAGIYYIQLETDFTKELPQDNPAIVLNNRVRDTFSGQDSVFVLVRLDPDTKSAKAVYDIRDPRVVKMLQELEDEMADKPGVDKVQSAAALFSRNNPPNTLDDVKSRLAKVPGSEQLFNRDYSATTVVVSANVGSSPQKVNSLTQDIKDSIAEVPKPPGVRMSVTGMPPVRVRIGQILVSDAQYTTVVASAIILLLLLLTTRPAVRGFLVFNPLLMSLIWTLGTMGWLGIPLSMVTVGVGAMIMGLGVEYGAFYLSVYENNREKGKTEGESLYVSLKEVGAAIFGSASTTVAGFLALLAASMPLMHHLGTALALGITYCFITTLAFNPSIIVVEEKEGRILLKKLLRMEGQGEGMK